MACTCRLGKKSGKMTRLKSRAKASGLPSEAELVDGQAALTKLIAKKQNATKRKRRGGRNHAA